MLLNAADQLHGNKNKVFKRLLERKTPLTVFTTLCFTGHDPSSDTPNYTPSQQNPGEKESIYCLPQDIVSAVDEQLRTASISSASTASSTGSTHQHTRRALSATSPELSRPNLINRTLSDISETKKKEKFFKNLSKHTRKHDQTGRLSASFRTEGMPSQAVLQQGPASQHDDQYEVMDNVVHPEIGTNSSFDEDSLLYEDCMGVNRNMSTNDDLPSRVDKIEVKTLALCWWSEKLNEMTDSADSRYSVYRVVSLKPY